MHCDSISNLKSSCDFSVRVGVRFVIDPDPIGGDAAGPGVFGLVEGPSGLVF